MFLFEINFQLFYVCYKSHYGKVTKLILIERVTFSV